MASTPGPEHTADVLTWSPATWSIVSERVGSILSVVQVVDAHLSTHSPVEWVMELARERRRADDAEADRDRLLVAAQKLGNFTITVDAITSTRMPSRADVEATRAVLHAAGVRW